MGSAGGFRCIGEPNHTCRTSQTGPRSARPSEGVSSLHSPSAPPEWAQGFSQRRVPSRLSGFRLAHILDSSSLLLSCRTARCWRSSQGRWTGEGWGSLTQRRPWRGRVLAGWVCAFCLPHRSSLPQRSSMCTVSERETVSVASWGNWPGDWRRPLAPRRPSGPRAITRVCQARCPSSACHALILL